MLISRIASSLRLSHSQFFPSHALSKDADRLLSTTRSDDPPSLFRRTESLCFLFLLRTPALREWCMPRRETGLDLHAGTFFLFLFALRFESRASSYPHPGSRNCFLSSYPVVLRAPSVPYAPLIEFFRYSLVRYTCCQ